MTGSGFGWDSRQYVMNQVVSSAQHMWEHGYVVFHGICGVFCHNCKNALWISMTTVASNISQVMQCIWLWSNKHEEMTIEEIKIPGWDHVHCTSIGAL